MIKEYLEKIQKEFDKLKKEYSELQNYILEIKRELYEEKKYKDILNEIVSKNTMGNIVDYRYGFKECPMCKDIKYNRTPESQICNDGKSCVVNCNKCKHKYIRLMSVDKDEK